MTLRNSKVAVSLGTDSTKNSRLVRFAGRLADAGRMDVDLVHVHESTLLLESSAAPYPMGLTDRAERLMRRMEATALVAAEEELRFASALLPVNVRRTEHVLHGDIVEEMRKFCDATKPMLLVVGVPPAATERTATWGSPSMSLINSGTVPILALPEDANLELPLHDLKVLVADDMRSRGASVLSEAIDFVRRVGAGRIIDAHVHSITGEFFSTAFADVFAQAMGRPTQEGSAVWRLVRGIRPKIKRALTERLKRMTSTEEGRGVICQSMVLSGRVVPALREAARRLHADLLVFGRHHAFHRDGDKLGSVPIRAMLRFHKPVLIVPT